MKAEAKPSDRWILAPGKKLALAPTAPASEWTEAVKSEPFQRLMRAKFKWLAPMMISYLAFFFLVMVLAGYAREFMTLQIARGLNLGYILIFATYLMCWGLAVGYVLIADRVFDQIAQRAVRELGERRA